MSETKCHELIILGCGASGMMAGCIAGKYCDDIMILDANNVPGKKLLATGNGRCNFTNIFMRKDRYNLPGNDLSSNEDGSSAVMNACDRFGFEDVLAFFERIGVPVRIINEYCYPYSLEAASVRDALYGRLLELGVKVKLSNRIVKVEKDNDREVFSLFTDSGYRYEAKKVILACAGLAGKAFGCDGSVYGLLESLGAKKIIKPLPALCGLQYVNKIAADVSGVRARAKVSLLIDDSVFKQESGEIIFSSGGISGIPVMNLSRYASRALDAGKKCAISLDFFEDMPKNALHSTLENMIHGRNVLLETALTGLLNHKLLEAVLKETGYFGTVTINESIILDRLIGLMKDFRLQITGTTGWENAQVTTGGLSLDEIDHESFETVFCKGLYVTGETLDVDGCCGGYNLQWAWSSGAIAGAYATRGELVKDFE